jgi:hypothetical protein
MFFTLDPRTVRLAEKGTAICECYIRFGDKFDIVVVEDLVTGDLTEALKGAWHLANLNSIYLFHMDRH